VFRPRVSRAGDGTYRLRLNADERAVLGTLVAQLRELLTDGQDPALRRLFPPAYADDPARDAEWRALVGDDLLARRLRAVDLVESTLAEKRLTEEQLTAWMGAVNDVRLVLGTKLDVDEDMDEIDPTDPDAPVLAAYTWLGWLLSEVVDVLAAGLPAKGAD
jgi:Domain of unknown function (DUF2017)